jgi:7-cyano-7-deazaguanine synthase in queuosine biosynthesis
MREYLFDFSTPTTQGLSIDSVVLPRQLPHVLPGTSLSLIHEDLGDVGLATTVTDRFAPRHRDAENTDSRQLHVVIPVRCPEVWQQAPVSNALQLALQFLTQDQWHIDFVPRSRPARSSQSGQVLVPHTVTARELEFSLYSGGADSTIGVALQGLRHPSVRQVVIAVTGGHLAQQQNLAFDHVSDELERRGAQRLVGVPFKTKVDRQAVRTMRGIGEDKRVPEDFSQRSRGFLFIALGAMVAASNRGMALHVYENGPGAINLPYSRASIGADHTRSMHPRFLFLMQQFLEALLGHSFSIHNPHWFDTKSEMAIRLAEAGLATLIPETISCERHNTRATGPRTEGQGIHCGICTSCLLREVSFRYARVPDSTYTKTLEELKADERRWLILMRDQAQTLHAAANGHGDPFINLLKSFPDLRYAYDGLRLLGSTADEARTRLTRLYRQYASEWQSVSNSSAALYA